MTYRFVHWTWDIGVVPHDIAFLPIVVLYFIIHMLLFTRKRDRIKINFCLYYDDHFGGEWGSLANMVRCMAE